MAQYARAGADAGSGHSTRLYMSSTWLTELPTWLDMGHKKLDQAVLDT